MGVVIDKALKLHSTPTLVWLPATAYKERAVVGLTMSCLQIRTT